jgi:peptidoglycan/xylan/chitin deacetylase (PgdA/CDA1 family)
MIESMNRRQFLRNSAIAATLAGIPLAGASHQVPEIAFTFDDPTTEGGANLAWHEVNERILATLASNKLKSILFVVGKRGTANPDNIWSPHGIALGI